MVMVLRPLYNDWCGLNQAVRNGSLSVRTAFAGMNISVAYEDMNPAEYLSHYDSSTGEWMGILPSIMTQIATLGGFQLNITTTLSKSELREAHPELFSDSNESMTEEYLRYYLEHGIDVMGVWTTDTADRCTWPVE